MRLYIKRSSPNRLLILLPSLDAPKALVFSHPSDSNAYTAVVEFIPVSELELDDCVQWSQDIVGIIGLVGGGGGSSTTSSPTPEIFLCLISGSRSVGNVRPVTSTSQEEPVSKITSVFFHSLTTSSWDSELFLSPVANTNSYVDPYDESVSTNPSYASPNPSPSPQSLFEHPLQGTKKILEAGSFFFADRGDWDLSSRLEERVKRNEREGTSVEEGGKEGMNEDRRFVWNEYMLGGLREWRDGLEEEEADEFDRYGFLIPVIQGFVQMATIPLPQLSKPMTLALVSRLSWRRAGTRFNTRGIDDDGNVANFVETETILTVDDISLSWTQLRGSVPLFWEQAGFQTFGQKIQITRPMSAAQLAFEKHFDELVHVYGSVHAVNLLGQKDNEVILTTNYNNHLRVYNASKPPPPLASITNFDFHGAVRVGGVESVRQGVRRVEGVRNALEEDGWTVVDFGKGGRGVVEEQKGVMRINCLDCLDRTNVVGEILSAATVESFLKSVNPIWSNIPLLWTSHSDIWANNGDVLSKVYAGTGAINTSFTRTGKRTLGGMLSDASKSVGRAYVNTFTDKTKQIAIDMLLGMLADQHPIEIFNPANQLLKDRLNQRQPEFSSSKQIDIFTGTWNLNGKSPRESLIPWLFPASSVSEPDVLSIAFQEIVPLTAQQIVQTDPEKRLVWERNIISTLANRPNKKDDYILIRSEQLVGTALLIFIKSSLAGSVRRVEGATKKTGLRGMSGNKGGVAIRMDIFDSSFCFVTAHFAAGHSNVAERNADFWTIHSGLRFLKGKTISSHENIIWAGDFNYRIDMSNEDVRDLAINDNLEPLLEADQLNRHMSKSDIFPDYQEGDITFRPTYKYDNGTDTYDTSEKARIPAWTDRILYRGSRLRQSRYFRAPLKTSDHRPVFSLFEADVQIIDQAKRLDITHQIKMLLGTYPTGTSVSRSSRSIRSVRSTLEEPVPRLPPPSSEQSQWWTEGDDDFDFVKVAAFKASNGNPWIEGS
ncbi:Inositol-1,4,5-triphosphate 5-phosphatase (synaptojanin), INP51/INP52/INP53 family [Phaffia rhodozyma]|uniref:phosphoinositide 5-phosphatase n=1 Tax=Phaffia rhodozyma TaxID=264483 RepID=A0A0F7SIM0_PHARH|nr:Inositol-1,4,5-triphosphate 5-phosphatase (synaptojanin), INP51/INP52/INP53 family [Phaffia rhodozyma]